MQINATMTYKDADNSLTIKVSDGAAIINGAMVTNWHYKPAMYNSRISRHQHPHLFIDTTADSYIIDASKWAIELDKCCDLTTLQALDLLDACNGYKD